MLLSKDLEGLYVSFVAKENVGLGLILSSNKSSNGSSQKAAGKRKA